MLQEMSFIRVQLINEGRMIRIFRESLYKLPKGMKRTALFVAAVSEQSHLSAHGSAMDTVKDISTKIARKKWRQFKMITLLRKEVLLLMAK